MFSAERRQFSPRETIGNTIIFGTVAGVVLAMGASFLNRPDFTVGAALVGFGLGGAGYIGKEGWRRFISAENRHPFLHKLNKFLQGIDK